LILKGQVTIADGRPSPGKKGVRVGLGGHGGGGEGNPPIKPTRGGGTREKQTIARETRQVPVRKKDDLYPDSP